MPRTVYEQSPKPPHRRVGAARHARVPLRPHMKADPCGSIIGMTMQTYTWREPCPKCEAEAEVTIHTVPRRENVEKVVSAARRCACRH